MADGVLSFFGPARVLSVSAATLGAAALLAGYSLINKTPEASAAGAGAPPRAPGLSFNKDLSLLAARPLFSPSRHARTPQKVEIAAGYTLKGVSMTQMRRALVLSGADGPVVLHEGESRNGFHVVKIDAKSAIVEVDGVRRTITLGRGSGAGRTPDASSTQTPEAVADQTVPGETNDGAEQPAEMMDMPAMGRQ